MQVLAQMHQASVMQSVTTKYIAHMKVAGKLLKSEFDMPRGGLYTKSASPSLGNQPFQYFETTSFQQIWMERGSELVGNTAFPNKI